MRFRKFASELTSVLPGASAFYPGGLEGTEDPEISWLVSDSRSVVPGAIFACVKGDRSDGHDFARSAMESGVAALLCERPLDVPLPQMILRADMRRKMGLAASVLYEAPASRLKMVALTGTNGKTTSTFMTKSILQGAGLKTGLLGTVYNIDGKECQDAEHTTPEGSDLQGWLHKMVQNSCAACVMETSSHAIDQGRIEGAFFDCAGFTNLTVDHLDYHLDMEGYFAAKRGLFDRYMRGDWKSAINLDDTYGRRLYDEYIEHSFGYSVKESGASFFARITDETALGMDIEMTFPDGTTEKILLPMNGSYNVSNALQSAALAWGLGVPAELCAAGLRVMPQIPGRLERCVIEGRGVAVIDFAHSPDGLEKVLSALRPVCKGRLIVAFGAGGDRDSSKRPLMGEAAARLADYVIITSDNPRSEDPAKIALMVEEGARRHSTERKVIVNRREAIFAGLDMMRAGDIFVIAGKGPERYQILKDGTIPFLDREQVLEWAALRGERAI